MIWSLLWLAARAVLAAAGGYVASELALAYLGLEGPILQWGFTILVAVALVYGIIIKPEAGR